MKRHIKSEKAYLRKVCPYFCWMEEQIDEYDYMNKNANLDIGDLVEDCSKFFGIDVDDSIYTQLWISAQALA